MTRRTVRKIQSFKIREGQAEVKGRAAAYRGSTVIPSKELLDWLAEDGDPDMVRVHWKREPYLIWKDDWEGSELS